MNNAKNNNKKQSFLEGAMTLMIATALVKVFGAVFKIPLGNMIGGLGMGYFSQAYDLYLPIYSIALAGLPIAVCRMVASYMAQGHTRDARVVLKVAQRTFLVIGSTATLILFTFAIPYLKAVGSGMEALPSILAIAPTVLFCCVMSTYRGYYEGMCNMVPTAISQIIESIGKVILGLGLVLIVKKMGFNEVWQSAAAIFGIMIGTLFGALYLWFRYKLKGDGITTEMLVTCEKQPFTSKETFKMLMVIAIPVVLGSLANQVASLVDVFTVQRRLSDIVSSDPESLKNLFPEVWEKIQNDASLETMEDKLKAIPTTLYGCYKGLAFSVFNLIPTITSVLGVSALPAMTTAFSKNDKGEVKRTYESVLKITALISLPAGFGIAALAGPIMNLLYPGQPTDAAVATDALRILGVAVLFSGFTLPMTSLLQAVGKERIPVINMAIGAGVKIVINYFLVAVPGLNISGAAIGTFACYAYFFISGMILLCKYTKVVPNIMGTFIKPLIAGGMCGLTAFTCYGLMTKFLNTHISDMIITMISIAFAAVIYVIAIVLLRVLTKNDILMLPKGEKIAKVLEKVKVI